LGDGSACGSNDFCTSAYCVSDRCVAKPVGPVKATPKMRIERPVGSEVIRMR
jgi:hypothetical protein